MTLIKNIIFDFDGTLADTAPLIVSTMQATIGELQLPARSDESCRSTIGLRLEDIPAMLWPEIKNIGEDFAATYRRIFNELQRPLGVVCFNGVRETIDALHSAGFRMAVASSRSHRSLDEYLKELGLAEIMDMVIGGDDVRRGKPAPDPVLDILSSMRWKPEETLTVGDMGVDVLMGRRAGTFTCGVTYGNGTLSELTESGADILIDGFARFPQAIRQLEAAEL